jgi:predicted Fe-Mo cluster-binding NifX family protein
VLQNAGVKIVTGAGGKVADVIEQFKKGELSAAAEADVEGHWL